MRVKKLWIFVRFYFDIIERLIIHFSLKTEKFRKWFDEQRCIEAGLILKIWQINRKVWIKPLLIMRKLLRELLKNFTLTLKRYDLIYEMRFLMRNEKLHDLPMKLIETEKWRCRCLKVLLKVIRNLSWTRSPILNGS